MRSRCGVDQGWCEFTAAGKRFHAKKMFRITEGYATIQFREVQQPLQKWRQLVQVSERDHRLSDLLIAKIGFESEQYQEASQHIISLVFIAVCAARCADKPGAELLRDQIWVDLQS